jgi:hypothetical protein
MMNHQFTRAAATTILLTVGGAFLSKIAEPPPVPLRRVAIGLVLFSVGLGLQLYAVSVYRRFRTSHLRKRPAERRPVLILFLSHLHGATLPPFVTITGDLDADLQSLASAKRQQYLAGQRMDFWSWEQTLRGINHNSRLDGPLERVVVIPSKQSVLQLHEFADRVFRQYPALKEHVRLQAFVKTTRRVKDLDEPAIKWAAQNGFDFEDFDEMTESLDEVIRQLLESNVTSRQIQIDFTGGQKPTSVVGAVVTLFSRVSNQYVSTNPRDTSADSWEDDVWGYDFQESPAAKD